MTTCPESIFRLRCLLLEAAIPVISASGWNRGALAEAAERLGLPREEGLLAFPGGGPEALGFWLRESDRQLAASLAATDMREMGVRQRVHHAIGEKFRLSAPARGALARASLLLLDPVRPERATGALWHTADVIWYGIGDRSADFGWYTKRASLAAVLASVLLFWYGDDSPDQQDSHDFAGRQLDRLLALMKGRATLADRLFRPGRAVCALAGRMRAHR